MIVDTTWATSKNPLKKALPWATDKDSRKIIKCDSFRGLDTYLRTGGYMKGKKWPIPRGNAQLVAHTWDLISPCSSSTSHALTTTSSCVKETTGDFQSPKVPGPHHQHSSFSGNYRRTRSSGLQLAVSGDVVFPALGPPLVFSRGTTGGPGHPVVDWPFPVT